MNCKKFTSRMIGITKNDRDYLCLTCVPIYSELQVKVQVKIRAKVRFKAQVKVQVEVQVKIQVKV